MTTGPLNLITDVAGLAVGNASDDTIKTGVTVLTAAQPFTASVHVMGGAPGTRETDLLAPDKTVAAVDALVLSGGSAFGLDACSGVMTALHENGRGFAVGNVRVPIVPGAILFDLINGGDKDWVTNPYAPLGKAAFGATDTTFELGSVGAGTGALTGDYKGGLGSASLVLPNGLTVGAIVAANPLGSVNMPEKRNFWAAPFEVGDEFGGLGSDTSGGHVAWPEGRRSGAMAAHSVDRANTTIGCVATDASLTKAQCHRLAVAAHDGIARAIVPAHSPFDGDLLFGISTGTGPSVDDATLGQLGHAAAICVARSIARGVFEAKTAEHDFLPTWQSESPNPI